MDRFGKKLGAVLIAACLCLIAGCFNSPDTDLMKAGLERSGMAAVPADCFAQKMADADIDGEIYNYLAKLMSEGGFSEKDAVNKARRKYGAEFKTPLKEARDVCVQ